MLPPSSGAGDPSIPLGSSIRGALAELMASGERRARDPPRESSQRGDKGSPSGSIPAGIMQAGDGERGAHASASGKAAESGIDPCLAKIMPIIIVPSL